MEDLFSTRRLAVTALVSSTASTLLAVGLLWVSGATDTTGPGPEEALFPRGSYDALVVLAAIVAASTLFSVLVAKAFLGRRAENELRGEVSRARDAVVQASMVKSEFLANVSHEIRTPLNGILGLAQLLLTMRPTPEQREYLEMIRTSGDSLLRLINDILDFSRIQAGKLPFDSLEFSLRKLVRETVNPLAPQAHLKDLEIVYWVEPEVPDRLLGDPRRLSQVIVNLLSNAIKFTETGDVVLRVGLEAPGDEGNEDVAQDVRLFHFTVLDTGIGIAESKHRMVFDSFAQGDGSATRKYGGSGLGLAICTQLVEKLGGRIWLESEEGQGSKFHFTARLTVVEDEQLEVDPAAAGLSELTALIVDSSPNHREILAAQLKRWGLKVVTTGDAGSALAAVQASLEQERLFSLVLMSSHLDGIDSLVLAQRIQSKIPRPQTIPGVFMTWSHDSVDTDTLRAHGFLGHLTKPIAPSHLLRAIEIVRRGRTVNRPEDVQTQTMDRRTLGGIRVLLAEDNPVNRTVAGRMLETFGTSVTAVENGRLALEALQHEHYDMVLMDLQMPDMDGIAAARAIRQKESESGTRIPIIALTAHARDEDRLRCLQAGMDDFLSKPFREEQLHDVMKRLLDESRPPEPVLEAVVCDDSDVVFDRAAALARANNDPALLSELSELLLDETPKTMDAIHNALSANNTESVERLAHRLKGSLLTLSAGRASTAALDLENAAGAGDDQACRRATGTLDRELVALKEELLAVVSHSKSPAG